MKRKVFGIGLSRTGTLSLLAALEQLGYRCVHQPWSIGELASFDAASDISVSACFEKLLKLWPDALFVYTTRRLEDWLDSCEKHWADPALKAASGPPGEDEGWLATNRAAELSIYRGWRFSRPLWTLASAHHHLRVMTTFMDCPERLLTLEIASSFVPPAEKWRLLCNFLGCIPPGDVRAFPHRHPAGISVASK